MLRVEVESVGKVLAYQRPLRRVWVCGGVVASWQGQICHHLNVR